MCFPSCCFSGTAWCMSIIIMASFPKTMWGSLFWRQDHLQLGELLFLVWWKLSFFYPSLEYSLYVSFWQPLLHKEILFLPQKYCLTRTGRVFFRQTDTQVWPLQVVPVAGQSCAHCMAVRVQALPSPQHSPQELTHSKCLGHQLHGTFVDVPQGMGHSWCSLMEQWRLLHIFVTAGRWHCVSWMPVEHSTEAAEETSCSKKNYMGKA